MIHSDDQTEQVRGLDVDIVHAGKHRYSYQDSTKIITLRFNRNSSHWGAGVTHHPNLPKGPLFTTKWSKNGDL